MKRLLAHGAERQGMFQMTIPITNASATSKDRTWNTITKLRFSLVLNWSLSALLCISLILCISFRRTDLSDISQNIGPKIVTAQQIKAGLSDMDAAAGNILLLPHNLQQEQNDDRYDSRRILVTESLSGALQNDRFNSRQNDAIRSLADGLGVYEQDAALARFLHLRDIAGSRLVYRMTHSQMHDTLLPAADSFSDAVSQKLEATYSRRSGVSIAVQIVCWTFAALSGASLLLTQIFLRRKMNRIFNLGLLISTLFSLLILLYTSGLCIQDNRSVNEVRASFDSLKNLWRLRAAAYDCVSEESRWLMDTPQAPQYEQVFAQQSKLIYDSPSGFPSPAEIDSDGLKSDAKGLLADISRNVRSDRAKTLSKQLLSSYGSFLESDKKLRAMELRGDHGGAVSYCVGRKANQHDTIVTRFNSVLDGMLLEEQSIYNSETAAGTERLVWHLPLTLLAFVATLVLSWIGLKDRIKEYSF